MHSKQPCSSTPRPTTVVQVVEAVARSPSTSPGGSSSESDSSPPTAPAPAAAAAGLRAAAAPADCARDVAAAGACSSSSSAAQPYVPGRQTGNESQTTHRGEAPRTLLRAALQLAIAAPAASIAHARACRPEHAGVQRRRGHAPLRAAVSSGGGKLPLSLPSSSSKPTGPPPRGAAAAAAAAAAPGCPAAAGTARLAAARPVAAPAPAAAFFESSSDPGSSCGGGASSARKHQGPRGRYGRVACAAAACRDVPASAEGCQSCLAGAPASSVQPGAAPTFLARLQE